MSWDLALSPYQDLLFSPGRDWQYVDGVALINQRIVTRLMIVRDSWLFDDTGVLGSHLDLALREDQVEAEANIDGLVREALDPINDEINIRDIHIDVDAIGQIKVLIEYVWLTPNITPFALDLQQLAVILPGGA